MLLWRTHRLSYADVIQEFIRFSQRSMMILVLMKTLMTHRPQQTTMAPITIMVMGLRGNARKANVFYKICACTLPMANNQLSSRWYAMHGVHYPPRTQCVYRERHRKLSDQYPSKPMHIIKASQIKQVATRYCTPTNHTNWT